MHPWPCPQSMTIWCVMCMCVLTWFAVQDPLGVLYLWLIVHLPIPVCHNSFKTMNINYLQIFWTWLSLTCLVIPFFLIILLSLFMEEYLFHILALIFFTLFPDIPDLIFAILAFFNILVFFLNSLTVL